MILHTVNKSPLSDNSLRSCIRCTAAGQSIILIEDGVYGALADTCTSELLEGISSSISLYALQEDLNARGINTNLISSIKVIDYAGFVDLTETHSSIQSWY